VVPRLFSSGKAVGFISRGFFCFSDGIFDHHEKEETMIQEAIQRVVTGNDLSEMEMEQLTGTMLDGKASASQVGALLTALRVKGETVEEITGAARAVRSRARRLQLGNHLVSIDRDEINIELETIRTTSYQVQPGTTIFNVSTATLFVAAGAGLNVVRHGSRLFSKYFGCANVLEELGIKLDIPLCDVERCLNEVGIGLLFAPMFESVMKHVAASREDIGIRSIFNLVGPLTNPADASVHVLGIYQPESTEKIAQVLGRLGSRRALVVCGEKTHDEISLCGPTRISQLSDGAVHSYSVEPENFGFRRVPVEALQGGDVSENARIIQSILEGEKGPRRDMVLLNAAAAFVAAGLDNGLQSGIQRAAAVIESGVARQKLEQLIRFTNGCHYFFRDQPIQEVRRQPAGYQGSNEVFSPQTRD
jgi:anthranilate phosphoribosyltransferase